MQLAMVGLGRMGANIVRRLMAEGHDCVVTDVNADAIAELEGEGATGAADLAELVAKTDGPRHVWIMVPVAIVDRIIDQLVPLLSPGDVIIDGGNSFYRHDIDRADRLAEQRACLESLRQGPEVQSRIFGGNALELLGKA